MIVTIWYFFLSSHPSLAFGTFQSRSTNCTSSSATNYSPDSSAKNWPSSLSAPPCAPSFLSHKPAEGVPIPWRSRRSPPGPPQPHAHLLPPLLLLIKMEDEPGNLFLVLLKEISIDACWPVGGELEAIYRTQTVIFGNGGGGARWLHTAGNGVRMWAGVGFGSRDDASATVQEHRKLGNFSLIFSTLAKITGGIAALSLHAVRAIMKISAW